MNQNQRNPDPSIHLVIPTVNEGRLLASGVPELIGRLPQTLHLLIVVNGGDPDSTQIGCTLSQQHDRVAVKVFERRLGKGMAITEGLTQADADLLGFVDADLPFSPEDLQRLIDVVLQGDADCCIASKWLGRSFGEVDCYTLTIKKLLSRWLNFFTRRLFGLPFSDTQGGAKFFTREAWQAIGGDFMCKGFTWDIELLYRLQERGLRVREIFCRNAPNRHSTFNVRELAKMSWELARLRWRLWFGPDR